MAEEQPPVRDWDDELAVLSASFRDDPREKAALLEAFISELIAVENLELVSVVCERAITLLLGLYVIIGDGGKYQALLLNLRDYFDRIPKARQAKLGRVIIQSLRKVSGTEALQIAICRDWIEWSSREERTLLRQRLQVELGEVYLAQGNYVDCRELMNGLINELRKVDYKSQLIDVFLLEARAFRGLGDISRAKASLTAARTNAAAIYVAPALQGNLDLENGILLLEDKDYRTAASYFSEAFDQFIGCGDPLAFDALKYGMVCRIFDEKPREAVALHAAAAVQLAKFGSARQSELEAIIEMARASENKDLHILLDVFKRRAADLGQDGIILRNMDALVDGLIEQHILRVVQPFSSVEIAHIANKMGVPTADVSAKLVLMILDKKLDASINEREGILTLFEPQEPHKVIDEGTALIADLEGVVDALYARCGLLA